MNDSTLLNFLLTFTHPITMLIESLLIVLYYRSFLGSKNKTTVLRECAFGGLYFAAAFAVSRLVWDISIVTPLVGVVILMCAVIAASPALFKANIKRHIFLLFSFFAIREISVLVAFSLHQMVIDIPFGMFWRQIESGNLVYAEDIDSYITAIYIFAYVAQIITYAAVISIFVRIVMKRFANKLYEFTSAELLYLISPCLAGISLAFVLRAINRPEDVHTQLLFLEYPFRVLILISGLILMFSVIAAIQLFQNLIKSYSDEKERVILQKQMQQFQEQIQDIDGIYTEVKGMRHDMKSHLANIRLLVKSDISKEAEIEEYLGKLEETVSKFDFVYQTGNSVCDVIIHQKYVEAKNNGIDFSADFIYPTKLNIDVYDLAVILNNGLENAIEACEKMAGGGYVKLSAYAKGQMFFVEIENSFAKMPVEVDFNTGLPRSSKPISEAGRSEAALHGMGLSNVRRCANKYLGDIDFQISHEEGYDVFRLIVMLQSRA